MNRPSYQITRHPLGSLRETWTLSYPLILGLLSSGMMIFVDRIMLGHYSVAAMNASATAGSAAFAFLILPMVIAGISEVFVGRFNGEGQFEKMGAAVWQMIWFSILMTPLFFLVAQYTPGLLFGDCQSPELNRDYFVWTMRLGSFFCLSKALIGFYIGQGKVKLVSFLFLLANILNIVLDYVLIYGYGFIPAYGISGAAVATVSAEAMTAIVLFIIFMRKKNRDEKGSLNFKIQMPLFVQSLKIGVPASSAHLSEYVAFFIFMKFINRLHEDFLLTMVILQTFYFFFFFIIEGISKGVIAVASNLIGAKKYKLLSKALKSGFKLHLLFVVVASLIFLVGSPGIFSSFLNPAEKAHFQDPVFVHRLYISSFYLCINYLFEGIAWILVGCLVASEDSRFIMIAGSISPWLLILLPVYIGISFFNMSVDQVWLSFALYSLCLSVLYSLRYRTSPWKKIDLQTKEPELLPQEDQV